MIWQYIEKTYPDTISWSLGTPARATKNHHYYEKCGFVKVDQDPLIKPEDNSLIFRKELLN